ncbi:FGGY-family carbohydrate kinase [Paradevosia shaoguanensis]|uniref:FGGY-family carbohydrate kinase n=1 Tax=Paradevosia shaoguanensis TaxID=1335043 RepID=UPI0019319EB9|nr:FGGY-family carbohydrate kinase [Paradevosia shaoguanensis]
MSGKRFIGVIDIGKTNAKFAVVDLETRSEVAVRKTPNTVLRDGLYPHFDIDALWQFLSAAIAELDAKHPLEALSVTTHGACAALVDENGDLALPVLDYEYAGPDEFDAEYAAIRPPFATSFTPPLPGGLNLGKQLFWQAKKFPEAFARTQWILPYPQYWSFRLTGVAASEITSLGCHTDLWNFETDLYSDLVVRQGWLDKMPEVLPAFDPLGPIKPELAAELGVRPGLPVYSGIHDSNASLLPHLLSRTPPFAVVSTGTWVIVAAPGGDLMHLDAHRDCLANIDAFGKPVPSARFMGGREFSLLTEGREANPSDETMQRVIDDAIMLLPSVVEGSGPFPQRKARWTHPREALDDETAFAVVSFYLALMTAECLALAGAEGDIVVEGPFAANHAYLRMLESAACRPVIASQGSATGTAIGAAMLARMEDGHEIENRELNADPDMTRYAWRWRQALNS